MALPLRTIRLAEITLDGPSSSSQGVVQGLSYLVRGAWEGKQVVVKKLLPECRQHILVRYTSSWHDLKHPNVSTVYGVSQSSEEPLFVVLPFYENGNIQEWIAGRDDLDRNRLVLDVALGMQYLHTRQIIHGSLMPSNILVSATGRACVSDYSMLQLQPSRNDDAYRYYSPEAWKGTTSQPSDVFAFAMCAFEIFSSSIPWGVLSEKRIYRLVVLEDARPDRPDEQICRRHGLTDWVWSILEEAWHKECRLRPSFDIILRMWQDQLPDTPVDGPDPATAFDNLDRSSPRLSRYYSVSAQTHVTGPPAYGDTTDVFALESEASPGYDDYTQVASTPNLPSESLNSQIHPTRIEEAFASPVQVHNTLIRGRGRGGLILSHMDSSPSITTVSSGGLGNRGVPLTPPTSAEPDVISKNRRLKKSSLAGAKRQSLPPSLNPPQGMMPHSHSAPAARRQFSLNSLETDYGRQYSTGISRSDGSVVPPAPFSNVHSDLVRELPTMSRLESLRLWEEGLVVDVDGVSARQQDKSQPQQLPPQLQPSKSVPVRRYYVHNYSLPSASVMTERRLNTMDEEEVSEGVPPVEVEWTDLRRGSSMRLNSQGSERSTIAARPTPMLLVQALQAEIEEGRKLESVDGYLIRMYERALESDKEAYKLVQAGAVPHLIHLLRIRAADGYGVELVLITLGMLAHDSISSNIIYRTGTTTTLIELCRSPPTIEVHTLTIWCLARICRSVEVAQSLIKQNLASILIKTCSATKAQPESQEDMNALSDSMIFPMALYTLGNLIQSDGIADYMASLGLVPFIANHLSLATGASSPDGESPNIDGVCSSIYALARISRSIKLAKALARAGCVELLSHHLKMSTDPTVLHWSARAVGCLMRPNSGDMAKVLLDAGVPKGLARLPTVLVLPEDDSDYHHHHHGSGADADVVVEPLGSFGFAIQRFSCAEWGGGTRKALVEAGVVDSLLAALRAVRVVDVVGGGGGGGSGSSSTSSRHRSSNGSSNNRMSRAHVELALAVSLLGDVGGSAIRKEIVNAGGIEILKAVGASAGGGEVKKACEMAVTSVTGNIFSRNAASAKTAMAHNWNGGCPDFYPPCPLVVGVEE